MLHSLTGQQTEGEDGFARVGGHGAAPLLVPGELGIGMPTHVHAEAILLLFCCKEVEESLVHAGEGFDAEPFR
ncbi:hypothetical protein ADL06_03635 [Streptomyces sp. NRRL F-6491]|nr:hypothetical protein ADL06_03635 [Streptomyces sp. NRRL F-6491]KOX40998.1 hypothetical protein ADL08_20805 [Streptomyces sp. NRRL F-6492]